MPRGVEGERVLGLSVAQHADEPDGAERQIENAPTSIHHAALYGRSDRVIPWRNCLEPEPALKYDVGGAQLGRPFNPRVFRIVAGLLAEASAERPRDACAPAA
jgi:hypothetical protein